MTLPLILKPRKRVQFAIAGYPVDDDWLVLGYKQRKPYNVVTGYDRRRGSLRMLTYTSGYGPGPVADASTVATYKFNLTINGNVRNDAYQKFKGNLYEQAALGVTFAETSQALAMLEKSAKAILASMRAVKSGNLVLAAQILGMRYTPTGGKVLTRHWSSLWLEYALGWVPFISTAWSAMEVLNDPIKTFGTAKGRANDSKSYYELVNLGSVSGETWTSTYYTCEQGGRVRAITDRGLFSLEQWGLLNPAMIAWELVPFSFVVDWFVNVGEVLSSYSDFAGMNLEATYISEIYRVQVTGRCFLNPGFAPAPGKINNVYNAFGHYTARVPGVWAPLLLPRSLRLPSASRAATAIALVIQQATGGSSRS